MKQIQDDGPGTLYGKRYRFRGIPKALWTAAGLRVGDDEEPAADLDIVNVGSLAEILLTSGAAGTTSWKLRADNANGALRLADSLAGTVPVHLANGAPTGSLWMTASGYLGFGEQSPGVRLVLADAGTMSLQLKSTDTLAGAGQCRISFSTADGRIWHIRAPGDASGNLILRNQTDGRNVLILDVAAPANSIYAGSSGVGFGTASPTTNVKISESNASTTPAQEVEQLGSGDAAHQVTIPGRSYAFGVDATDSKWKLCTSATPGAAVLGTGTLFAISSAGVIDSLKSDTVTKASGTPYDAFPSGTKLVFYQASPPSGWTQDTANADACLRVVSGSGGGTGGSLGISSASVSGHVLTISELPAHSHPPFGTDVGIEHLTASSGGAVALAAGSQQWNARASTGFTGADASHTHGLALKYIDVIVASKN